MKTLSHISVVLQPEINTFHVVHIAVTDGPGKEVGGMKEQDYPFDQFETFERQLATMGYELKPGDMMYRYRFYVKYTDSETLPE
jgi:hypothetical protein